jgi:hypothetical protein
MNDKKFAILKSRQVGKSYINLSYLYEWESAIVSFKRREKLRKIFNTYSMRIKSYQELIIEGVISNFDKNVNVKFNTKK